MIHSRKFALPVFVAELISFECLECLRDEFVAEKIDMMFGGMNFLQRVT